MRKLAYVLIVWVSLSGIAFAQSSFDDIDALPSGEGTAVTDSTIDDEPPAAPVATTTTVSDTSTTTTTSSASTGPEIFGLILIVAIALVLGMSFVRTKKAKL